MLLRGLRDRIEGPLKPSVHHGIMVLRGLRVRIEGALKPSVHHAIMLLRGLRVRIEGALKPSVHHGIMLLRGLRDPRLRPYGQRRELLGQRNYYNSSLEIIHKKKKSLKEKNPKIAILILVKT